MLVKDINPYNMTNKDCTSIENHIKIIMLDQDNKVLVHKVGDYIELPTFDTITDKVDIKVVKEYISDVLSYNLSHRDMDFYFMERIYYKKGIPEQDIDDNTVDKTKFYIVRFNPDKIRQEGSSDYVKDVYFVPISEFIDYINAYNLNNKEADESTLQLLRLFNDYGFKGEFKQK